MIDIARIREYFAQDAVYITNHAVERFRQRGICMKNIKQGMCSGEVIEQYPEDFPFPSCLILGYMMDGKPIHIVLSDEGSVSRIITAYIPTLDKWEKDYKTRKG